MAQRTRNPAAKQQAVLAAAQSAFGEVGFEATSAASIARAAGVAEGTVFHYFGSKHGLLEACSASDATRFAADELAHHSDQIDYDRWTGATFRWIASDPMIRRLWLEDDDRIVGALRRGWQRGIVPVVAGLLLAEQLQGRCRAGNVEWFARLQFAVMGEALVAHFNNPDQWPRAEAISEVSAVLARMVATP